MLILYLAGLMTSLYWVSKTLLPEMAKPPLRHAIPKEISSDDSELDEAKERITKLEALLAEKNKNLQSLQTELKIFLVYTRDFEKVKSLLEAEVHRLREQNSMFRSEFGMPSNLSINDNASVLELSKIKTQSSV